MGDFFHGWRRKIGVLTLVMALVFMAMWVRSLSVCDRVLLGRSQSHQYLESRRGRLGWERTDPWFFGDSLKWESSDASKEDDIEYHEASRYKVWRWKWGGFAFGSNSYHDAWSSRYCVIPYWSIAIPLTLLSAYLLLSKPRPSTSEKLRDPIPKTVA